MPFYSVVTVLDPLVKIFWVETQMPSLVVGILVQDTCALIITFKDTLEMPMDKSVC